MKKGILNKKKHLTQNKKSLTYSFQPQKPQLRLTSHKTILPYNKTLPYSFEAVNINAVDIRINKIYQHNIAPFLQQNNLNGSHDLQYLGEQVLVKTIKLDTNKNLTKWNKHTIDLASLIKKDPTALYHIELGIRRSYSLYPCDEQYNPNYDPSTLGLNTTPKLTTKNFWKIKELESDNWDYDERNNPCHPFYYDDYYYRDYNIKVSSNILASNIGLIVKEEKDKGLYISTSSINSTKALKSVRIDLLNYENRIIKTVYTNDKGVVHTKTKRGVQLVIASSGNQRGYLKLDGNTSLSLGRFDTDGISRSRNVQGMLYAERGVWRPGDSIFVNLIVNDKGNNLPSDLPIGFELINPKGQTIQRYATADHTNRFYAFHTKTALDAPTGNYEVKAYVGSQTFYKTIKIETVRPNRLKIDYQIKEKELLSDSIIHSNLLVNWLHGAKGKYLNTKIKASISHKYTSFKGYSKYSFKAPFRNFESYETAYLDDTTNTNGELQHEGDLSNIKNAPGKLNVSFNIKVFEKGGRFSVDKLTKTLHPFQHYVGVKLHVTSRWGDYKTHENVDFNLVNLNHEGNLSEDKLEITVYKVDWNWWYQIDNNKAYKYKGKVNLNPLKKEYLKTTEGKAKYKLLIKTKGRYLVLIKNSDGHTTGKMLNYYDDDNENIVPIDVAEESYNKGTQKLELTANKEKYNVGDHITLSFPTNKKGRALITIEDGQNILKSKWVNITNNKTTYTFKSSSKMAPYCYANVIYIQPYQHQNNLPIHMYSVIPIKVEYKNSHLSPVISMKETLEPKKRFKINIKEKKGLPMTYTIALVEEGLLDLTNYKTPDVWKHFNTKQSLEIKTYDVYDDVIKTDKINAGKLLSLGGDGSNKPKDGAKLNRFKPMVKFIGPFHVKANNSKNHYLTMPNYIGSLRVMVIAGHQHAYGSTNKTVKVKSPLMVLGSLPRVLGPNEELHLPVNIFAMNKDIKDVKVTIESNDVFEIEGKHEKEIHFDQPSDQTLFFGLKTNYRLGIGKIKITATSGKYRATYDLKLEVRPSNTPRYETLSSVIAANTVYQTQTKAFGLKGTNTYSVEVSTIPPINLKKRLEYLIHYPYGCVEQTTSSVFPQLHLNTLMELSHDKKIAIEKNINAGIERLERFQTDNGGFSYWPNQPTSHEWGTNYAGHFLVEAQLAGFLVDQDLLENWVAFQTNYSEQWNMQLDKGTLTQAYRLFLLAKCKQPNIGAMNRLRLNLKKGELGNWYLAAAYILIGQQSISEDLIKNAPLSISAFSENDETFGSSTRDLAIILQMLCELRQDEKSALLAKNIATLLNNNKWMSTQTTAYSLLGMAYFVKSHDNTTVTRFDYNSRTIELTKSLWQEEQSFEKEIDFNFHNHSNSPLFLTVVNKGIPNSKDTVKESKGILLTVNYYDLNKKKINPDNIKQGEDFTVEIKVKNTGNKNYQRVSLTQIFPSGWEINNSRLNNTLNWHNNVNYEDIRDDRVNLFYNLGKKETKTFKFSLNASFPGKYYLPATQTEAMYNHSIRARITGKWIRVVKDE